MILFIAAIFAMIFLLSNLPGAALLWVLSLATAVCLLALLIAVWWLIAGVLKRSAPDEPLDATTRTVPDPTTNGMYLYWLDATSYVCVEFRDGTWYDEYGVPQPRPFFWSLK